MNLQVQVGEWKELSIILGLLDVVAGRTAWAFTETGKDKTHQASQMGTMRRSINNLYATF